jgi:predicted Zn-dependent peptidase
VPENAVLAVAGNLTHEEVLSLVSGHVRSWAAGPFAGWNPARDGQDASRVGLRSKRTEQAQLLIGYPAYPALHPDRYTLDVLNTILGEGMSSRLFLEIRENRGLAYDVHSSVGHYQDTGAFVVSAAVDPRKADECIRALLGELDAVRGGLVPLEELNKAKQYIAGRLMLRMEDSRAVSSWIGGQELLRKEIRSVDDILAAIQAVTPEDLVRVANDVIRAEKANLAVVGPYRSVARFERLLR